MYICLHAFHIIHTGCPCNWTMSCPVQYVWSCIGFPLTLPCLHSFCAECLRELVQGSNGPTLTCPQCRADVQIPGGGVANFPKNFNLESIVQKVKHHREQREASQSHVKSEGLEDEYCYQEEPPVILMTITKTILFILQLWRFLRV